MRPASGPPVPSKNILRFLKAQTESTWSSINSSDCGTKGRRITSHARTLRSYRYLSTTTRKFGKHPNSRDEVFSRQHEPLKALPAPRQSHLQSYNRHASTRSPRPQRNNGWSAFWSRLRRNSMVGSRREQEYTQTRQEDTSQQLFNLSRALARSPTASDQKLRCTEFDANGSVTLVSGEFKKSELIAKYGLQPRDLRKIDSSVLPHILVRPSAILLNLLHLRVLIQSDRVLVFDAYGSTDSYTQSLFMYDLEGKLRQKPDPRNTSTYLPYEFRALEAVLISVTSGLEAEFALVRDPVTQILAELEEDIDREKLRHLLIHSKKLGTFEQKARLVRDAIDDLLEADDDLATMYLTERKQNGKPREENDHTEVEMLLESYHKICDEIVEISGNLISNIRNTEEVVKAILDANRNQLMLLEIKFSVGTLGLAGGTLIAGLYGMNLNSFIEETDWGFGVVTGVSFVISGIICMYGMRKLRKVQKVRMWGEGMDSFGSAVGRGNWRNDFMESHARNVRVIQEAMKAQQQAQSQWFAQTNASTSGPVLWPGMDGLGMHKLNSSGAPPSSSASATATAAAAAAASLSSSAGVHAKPPTPLRETAGGQVDEETGHGYTNRPKQSSSTILDPFDFRSNSEEDQGRSEPDQPRRQR